MPSIPEAPSDHRPDSGDPEEISRRRISRRNRKALRDLHHRTWELELVVSGAILFVLSQVPGRLDRLHRMDAVAGDLTGLAVYMGYYFLKLMVYTLVVAFALHLFTRAFWVGLDSVCPRGIRWDRLNQGPNVRRVFRSMLPTVRELVVKTDAVASVIFAAALAVVGGLGASIAALLVFMALVLGASAVIRLDVRVEMVALAVVGAIAFGTVALQGIDRLLGTRLAPTGWVARFVRRITAISARITGLEIYGPVQFTLFSHIGGRRASVALAGVILALVAYFIAHDVILARGLAEYAVTGFAPAEVGALGVDPVYYETYRRERDGAGEYVQPWVPTIPVETLGSEDVWLRIFVPVRPSIDNEALTRICPDAALSPAGGFRARDSRGGAPPDSALPTIQEGLDCVSRLWTVSLDGAPVTASPVFMRHPDSRLTGVVRYLDTRELTPGRHRIQVVRAAEARPPDDPGPPVTHDILFWR